MGIALILALAFGPPTLAERARRPAAAMVATTPTCEELEELDDDSDDDCED